MKKISVLYAVAISIVFLITLQGQSHQPVFPGLNGQDLEIAVQNEFTPSTVLDYGMARDTLYKLIDSRNDIIYGVYTDMAIYLPPGEDPTEFLFMNGSSNGINTEHSWPRSKGAREGNANSDMHHLFPTRTPVNADRGSLPFGESDDDQTRKWYYQRATENDIPIDRDLYSELGLGVFEPREASKGNIARACFYFYTIYREEALDADPQFFEVQREALCQWHLDDPVDEEEWERSSEIAFYQDGKNNPFILDCTLAHRMYCSDFEQCQPVVHTNELISVNTIQIYPNPSSELFFISGDQLSEVQHYRLELFDLQGRKMLELDLNYSSIMDGIRTPQHKGLFLLKLTSKESGAQFISKLIRN